MRRQHLFGPLLIPAALLGIALTAGCGGATTPDAIADDPGTTVSSATVSGATASSLETASGGEVATPAEVSTTVSGATPASGSTPTSGPTIGSGPDAGTTSTDSAGLPAPITPEEIKLVMQSAGMGSPDQLTIYQYKNFAHYAAAYVMAADENVYVVLFNDETGGWVALDMITGLDWPAMQAELRLKGAPEDLIEWAYPGEG